jgi:hypothetical protein
MVMLTSLSGCGSVWNVQHLLLSGSTFPKQPENHAIELFTGGVARPHVEIARIDVSEKPMHGPSSEQWSTEAAIEQLRVRARELGADALKNLTINVGSPGTIGARSVSASAVAIRWK